MTTLWQNSDRSGLRYGFLLQTVQKEGGVFKQTHARHMPQLEGTSLSFRPEAMGGDRTTSGNICPLSQCTHHAQLESAIYVSPLMETNIHTITCAPF